MEYVFLFITLYFQIFFLVTFIEKSDIFFDTKVKRKRFRNMPLVSLIVPCWNEEDTVLGTIDSIMNLKYPKSKIEIVVVDDGSTDGTWDQMQKLKKYKNIKLIKKENGGKHTANNVGIENSTGEYVATIDADTFLKEDALCEMMSEFRRDRELDAIGSTVLVRDPRTLVQYAQMIQYQMFSFTKILLASIGGALVVPGAFSIYKREVFDQIGKFKDGHKLEDLEFTYRMQRAGMNVGQCRNAIAYTNAPDSIMKLWNQRKRWGYGFLKNTYDYKDMFTRSKNSSFGFFTLPSSAFTYIAILIAFFTTLYVIVENIYNFLVEVNLLGFGVLGDYIKFTEISLTPSAIIYAFIYLTVIWLIIFGKYTVRDKSFNPFPVIVFFAIFSVFMPILVVRNIYDSVTKSSIRWR